MSGANLLKIPLEIPKKNTGFQVFLLTIGFAMFSAMLNSEVSAKSNTVKSKSTLPANNEPAPGGYKPIPGLKALSVPAPDAMPESDSKAAKGVQSPVSSLQNDAKPPSESVRKILEGGVEHLEALPPVAPSLQPGQLFNPDSIPKPKVTNNWYWLPAWSVGLWRHDRQTVYYFQHFAKNIIDQHQREIVSEGTELWGSQQDRNGVVWDYQAAPYSIDIDSGDHIEIQQVQLDEPVEITQQKVTKKFRGIITKIDKRTNRITSSDQSESIQIYTPCGPQCMRCDSSMKTFDELGRAKYLQMSIDYIWRVSPFKPLNVFKGRDLLAMFKEYLQTNGLGSLAP